MNNVTEQSETKPDYVLALEAAYGALSQAGFGSAVFYKQLNAAHDLEKAALAKHRTFVGDLWERYGQEAWMGPWKGVYVRAPGTQHDVVAELRGITVRDAASSVPMILENVEGAEKARAALSTAYDEPAVTDLRVFNLGDGGAMSGVLVAARHTGTGEATFLVFLMD